MESSRPAAKWTFIAICSLTVVLAAISLALMYPAYRAARLHLADRLATAGSRAAGAEAVADFQLAAWLNPRNHRVIYNLAQRQLAAGHSTEALTSLEQAGDGADVTRLKLKTYLEAGQIAQATSAAESLTFSDAAAGDLVLACLAYAVAGRPGDCSSLAARLSDSEALEATSQAQVGKLPLAAQLLANGLPNSASSILSEQPTSFQRNLLLGRIHYQTHTTASLAAAADYLSQAVEFDPSSIAAHQLLAAVYHDLNRTTEAADQDTLVTKLISGRP